jgi:hypothetical protein
MKTELFTKAQENIKAAQLLFDNQLYNASVNSAYYAAFQSAIVCVRFPLITVYTPYQKVKEILQESSNFK